MTKEEPDHFYPTSQEAWRQWLHDNHRSAQAVWLVCYKKKAGVPTISWSEAVDEALCFGWIDSVRKTLDNEKFIQFFSRRKPKSTWSKVNKEKIEDLIATKRMTQAGLDSIQMAKENGSWTILDTVEALVIPPDLETAFESHPDSKERFLSLSKSVKKAFLHRLVFAKQAATREKRIEETIAYVNQSLKTQ